MQPGNRTFYDPAAFAQTAAVRGTAPSDRRANAFGVQGSAISIVVVVAVSMYEERFTTKCARLSANRRDARYQGQRLGNVVPIGSSQNHRNRDILRIRKDVMLRTQTTAIGRAIVPLISVKMALPLLLCNSIKSIIVFEHSDTRRIWQPDVKFSGAACPRQRERLAQFLRPLDAKAISRRRLQTKKP